MRPWSLSLLLLVLALHATPAFAVVQPAPVPDASIALPAGSATRIASELEARALGQSPAWQAFRAEHGSWTAEWNAVTGSPHRAYGPSFELAGFANDAPGVDRAVRAFVASEPALFGTNVALATASLSKPGRVWYASYRLLVGGLPVLFADWGEPRAGSTTHALRRPRSFENARMASASERSTHR